PRPPRAAPRRQQARRLAGPRPGIRRIGDRGAGRTEEVRTAAPAPQALETPPSRLGWVQRPRVLTPTRARRLPFRGSRTNGSDIMRKALKRVLDQLRDATNGLFRAPTAIRDRLQEPQQLQVVPVRAGTRP